MGNGASKSQAGPKNGSAVACGTQKRGPSAVAGRTSEPALPTIAEETPPAEASEGGRTDCNPATELLESTAGIDAGTQYERPPASESTEADEKVPELLAEGVSTEGGSPSLTANSAEGQIESAPLPLPETQADGEQVAPLTPDKAEGQLLSSVDDGELQSEDSIPEQEPSQQSGVSSSVLQEAASREHLALVPYEPLVPLASLYTRASDARDHESTGGLSSSFRGVVTASSVVGTLLEDSRYITVRNLVAESSWSSERQRMPLIHLAQSGRLDFTSLNTLLHAVGESEQVQDDLPEEPVLHVALITGRMTLTEHVHSLWQQVVPFSQLVHEFSVQLHLFHMMLEMHPSRAQCCPQQGWTCEHIANVFSEVVDSFTYMTNTFSRQIVAHPDHKPEQGVFNVQEAFRRSQPRHSPRKEVARECIPADDLPPAMYVLPDSGDHFPTTHDCDSADSPVSTPETEPQLGITQLEQEVDSDYHSQRLSTEDEAQPMGDDVEQPEVASVETSRREGPQSADAALLLDEPSEQQENDARTSSQGSSQRGTLGRFFRSLSVRRLKGGQKKRRSDTDRKPGESD